MGERLLLFFFFFCSLVTWKMLYKYTQRPGVVIPRFGGIDSEKCAEILRLTKRDYIIHRRTKAVPVTAKQQS